ncbi:MAG: sigma-70 family RNA polymerase sigma factor [Rhodospirillum sp.]|nr:sigma-70 family RNA polymerase sigma factor [Rhodospirillum sp.]MCF8490250.1 sigma-70 family RNA polymerase sigma factor [Rhodospirillum sp.]MCF8501253.1 sigma-70 family RNA polymerase sigma factor [Rhodospirillum sp.]
MARNKSMLDLFMAHRVKLVDYASDLVGNRARGEEVVQEAWLRFYGATTRTLFDEPLGYLYRIVRNIALDGRRKQVREARYGTDVYDTCSDTSLAASPSPETEAIHREQLAIVQAALAELPERTRVALEMHRMEGYKLKEIAAHFGISITLAHSLIAEGVNHCRRRLASSNSGTLGNSGENGAAPFVQ